MNYSISTNDLEEFKTYLAAGRLAAVLANFQEWLNDKISKDEEGQVYYVKIKEELQTIIKENIKETT